MWDPKSWLRSLLVEAGRKALARQPAAIVLSRSPQAAWRMPAAAERLAAPLRGKGFVELGIYEIQPLRGYRLGIMLNERDMSAAYLNELPTGSVTLELSARYLDGTTTALVNYGDNGVPRPPFFRVIFAGPDASSAELYERFLRERPSSGLKTITAENVVAEYQAAYAKIIAFSKGMGLTATQVRDIAARARRPATYLPSGGKGACPHCGQPNESQREVCWACFKLLSGDTKPAVEALRVAPPLREQLLPGERVLWHGRPIDKLDYRDIPLIAFPMGILVACVGLFFLRFSGPWTLESTASPQFWARNMFSMIISGFFFMAGALVTCWPFIRRMLRRGDYYAVTDRRVLIVHERPWRRVIARDLTQVATAVVVFETFEGAGDVELGFDCWTAADSDFKYVENARDVAGLIYMARQEAATRPLPVVAAGDAPAGLASLIVPLHFAAVALCLLLALSDLAEILITRGRILKVWAEHQDGGVLPPASVILLAPVMAYFLYGRLTRFQAGTRRPRTADVLLTAAFVGFEGVLFFGLGPQSFPKTFFCLIMGAFLLIGAPGREAPSAAP